MKQKVIIYVVQGNSLLVFRHVNFTYEEVGLQVPSGTVKENEIIESAAFRELTEETGMRDFEIITYLGSENYNMSPYRNEIQERHFFLAKSTKNLPSRWFSNESHDGIGTPTEFEFFWVPLERGHIIQSGQSVFLWKTQDYLK